MPQAARGATLQEQQQRQENGMDTPPILRATRLSTPSASNSRTPSVRRAETDDSEKAGRVWARTVDDAWLPCILTLDGGGIRGYSSLLILKALMHEVWLWELRLDDEENATGHHAKAEDQLLPCHYFDFMYGTSTGGLIATMLGRLRMTIEECLVVYREVGEHLFGRRRSSLPLATKYHHEPLEKAVQKIVASRCYEHDDCDGRDDLHPWQMEDEFAALPDLPFDVDKPRVCQSCCLTAVHNDSISEAYLLRTYPHYYLETAPNWITRYNEGADELKIWQVTRATSAAPFYFKMLEAEVEGETKGFQDGGIRENNPSGAAISEFHSLYSGKADRPALLLSVGTGRPDMTQDGFAHTWSGPISRIPWAQQGLQKLAVVRNLLIKYTEGEDRHRDMRLYAEGEHTWYKRLNVTYGLQNMPLDEWVAGEWNGQKNVPGGASLRKMEKATEEYLDREFIPEHNIDTYAPPVVVLRQAAEKLVRQRRAREKEGGIRWDAFVGKYLRRPRSFQPPTAEG